MRLREPESTFFPCPRFLDLWTSPQERNLLEKIVCWLSETEERRILAARIIRACASLMSSSLATALAGQVETLGLTSGEQEQDIRDMLKAVADAQSDEGVARRISSLIAADTASPETTSLGPLKNERGPENEIEQRLAGMRLLADVQGEKVTPLKRITINVSGSETLKSQEIELQRLADEATYGKRQEGLLTLASTLSPALDSEAAKVAEASGILGPRLRAEFELACLRARGTHTQVANLMPVLTRWMMAPGTYVGSSDGPAFQKALGEVTDDSNCKLLWDSIAERLPFLGRACLLSKLPSLAPLITRLEPEGRHGIVAAILDVHRWWP